MELQVPDSRSEFQYDVLVWHLEELLKEQRMVHQEHFSKLEQLRHSGQTSVPEELKSEIIESTNHTRALRETLKEVHTAMHRAKLHCSTFEEEFNKLVDAEMQELAELVRQQRENEE